MELENSSSYELSQEERYRFHFGMALKEYILGSQGEGFNPTIFDLPLEFDMPNDRLVVQTLDFKPIHNCVAFTSLFKVLESNLKVRGRYIFYDYNQETKSENEEMYEFLRQYREYMYPDNNGK